MAIIGIDLGTTNSLAVAFRDGTTVFIPNHHGEILTPSVVGLDEKGSIIVGKTAKERLVTDPSLTTSLFKRNMGEKTKVSLGKRSFLPEELSSFVLRQLIEDAKIFLGTSIEEVVISVPAYFNMKQRAMTKRAGLLAGVKVERLLNEPSAAAIACRKDEEDDIFIVFDFGGGTLDVSIVEVFDNVVNICAISGDNQLGGREFDQVIFKAFCEENQINEGELTGQERESILRLAEISKIKLYTEDQVELKAKVQGKEAQMILTNEKLTNLSEEIFRRMRDPIKKAMVDSGLQSSQISKCILVGGSCHMPIVQLYLGILLRVPVVADKELDYMVGKGLGIFVGIKERTAEVKDLVLTDICPYSLKINLENEMNPKKPLAFTMIPRNSILPKRVTEPFFTSKLGQTRILINVRQGEEMYDDENLLLGKLIVKVPRNTKEHEQTEITFFYDINAILAVNVRVLSTGEEYSLVLTGDGIKITDQNILQELMRNLKDIEKIIGRDDRHSFLVARGKRIYAEGNATLQEHLKTVIRDLEKLGEGTGSIQKKHQAMDEFEKYFDELEAGGEPDIFRVFSHLNDEEDTD